MSLMGTFAVMYLLDYSLDNLSLMALTLAVGFVVDDAIVMLENIVRHMEMGKPPMQAALDGAAEIGFTIISMTLVADRRVHPAPVHGRDRRPAVPRVRGHDRRGDSRLRVRLAHADADARRAFPEPGTAARLAQLHLRRVRGGLSDACSRLYTDDAALGDAAPSAP